MSFLGEIEQFVADDLYPYRWPITVGALIALAAAVGVGYRKGWHNAIWRHKLASSIVAVAVLAVTVPAGDYLLSPLWERSFLEEASPLAAATDDVVVPGMSPPDATAGEGTIAEASPDIEMAAGVPSGEDGAAEGDGATSQFATSVAASGEWEGTDSFHFASGQALLIETAPDTYTLRVEDFSVRNGPDLFVYLSPSEDGFADGAINLGDLKATDGAFNYDVPPGTDVSQFKSAIVWCKRFAVLFAVAPLIETQ